MNFTLDDRQRADCSIDDLSRIICRYMQNKIRKHELDYVGLTNMYNTLSSESRRGSVATDLDFCLKFYEAIARLKQRGILMTASPYCFESVTDNNSVCFTSVGAKTDFDEELLILIDDAYEVVQALKEKIPNLDPVVEQYYLESLRTCQYGSYISSVISLGAASERSIHCLAEAVVQRMPEHKNKIEGKRNISALTRYLSDNSPDLFNPLDSTLRKELKEKLDLLANIYRLNRNDAGHPSSVPQDWNRADQECHLSSFRRLAILCFRAIDELNRKSAGSALD